MPSGGEDAFAVEFVWGEAEDLNGDLVNYMPLGSNGNPPQVAAHVVAEPPSLMLEYLGPASMSVQIGSVDVSLLEFGVTAFGSDVILQDIPFGIDGLNLDGDPDANHYGFTLVRILNRNPLQVNVVGPGQDLPADGDDASELVAYSGVYLADGVREEFALLYSSRAVGSGTLQTNDNIRASLDTPNIVAAPTNGAPVIPLTDMIPMSPIVGSTQWMVMP